MNIHYDAKDAKFNNGNFMLMTFYSSVPQRSLLRIPLFGDIRMLSFDIFRGIFIKFLKFMLIKMSFCPIRIYECHW